MASIASTSSGCAWIEVNASRPKRSSTPASMAEASASGMRPSMRSKIPENPAITISNADSAKPAIASSIATPAALVTSTAAPGVDQAVTTGIFQRSDRPMQVTPMPMPSAHIHEAVCAGVASSVCAAWNTIAAVLAKPTSTVTKPAATADSDWSRSRRVRVEAFIAGILTRHRPVGRWPHRRPIGAVFQAANDTGPCITAGAGSKYRVGVVCRRSRLSARRRRCGAGCGCAPGPGS